MVGARARHRGLKCLLVETSKNWYGAIGLCKRCDFLEYGWDDISAYMALEFG